MYLGNGWFEVPKPAPIALEGFIKHPTNPQLFMPDFGGDCQHREFVAKRLKCGRMSGDWRCKKFNIFLCQKTCKDCKVDDKISRT